MQASRGFVGTYIGLEVRIVGPRLAPFYSSPKVKTYGIRHLYWLNGV